MLSSRRQSVPSFYLGHWDRVRGASSVVLLQADHTHNDIRSISYVFFFCPQVFCVLYLYDMYSYSYLYRVSRDPPTAYSSQQVKSIYNFFSFFFMVLSIHGCLVCGLLNAESPTSLPPSSTPCPLLCPFTFCAIHCCSVQRCSVSTSQAIRR